MANVYWTESGAVNANDSVGAIWVESGAFQFAEAAGFNLRPHADAVTYQGTSVDTISGNLDTGSGDNRSAWVIVRARRSAGAVEVSSVTVGGQPATKVVQADDGGGS